MTAEIYEKPFFSDSNVLELGRYIVKSIKVIVGIAFAFTVIGAMLIGGFTAASFTGTARNSASLFVSGDLKVTIDHPDGEPYFDLSNIAPGDHGSAEILVSNTGDIDMVYVLTLLTSGTLVKGEHPLVFNVYDKNENIVDLMSERSLSAGEQELLVIAWQMPKEAGNEYQNASTDLDIRVAAEQVD